LKPFGALPVDDKVPNTEGLPVTTSSRSTVRKILPLIVFALALLLIHNSWRLSLWFNPPITDHLQQQDVLMFSTSWCGYCAKARRFFTAANIPYTELDIERSQQAKEHYQKLGGRGVPFIIIGDQTIQGFDSGAIRQAVDALATSTLQ
jgi:glutaredoxin